MVLCSIFQFEAMPQVPPPSPATREQQLKRKRDIEQRDRKVTYVIKRYEEEGEDRRAAVTSGQSIHFGDDAKKIKLPPQTITSPRPRC